MCNWCLQILYNTQPSSYTASCTPVTDVQVGQSVIPPGTNIPTNAQPPPQVTSNSILRRILSSLATACLLHAYCTMDARPSWLPGICFQLNFSSLKVPACHHVCPKLYKECNNYGRRAGRAVTPTVLHAYIVGSF